MSERLDLRAIAKRLDMRQYPARGHSKTMGKPSAHSRPEAVAAAIRTGLLSRPRALLSSLLLRPARPPLLSGIAVAALCIAIETLLAYPLGLVADGASLGVVYVPGVLLVATVWGLWLGMLTVVGSTVAFVVFHLAPTRRYVDSDTEEWIVLTMFLAVALLAGFVADLAKSRAVEIQKRHRDSELAAELAHVLLRAEVESIHHGGGRRIGEGEVPVAGTTVDREDLYVAALRDVARRRQQERELQSALDHQTSVVAIAAHELQNPLAAIRAFTHPLRNPHYPGTAQQRTEIADRIAERAEVLQALVRKLLTASRIDAQPERGPQECVPVLQLIRELLAEFDAAGQDVHVSCSPALEAFVDRGEFSEMLVNYLDNALAHGSAPFDVRVAERDGWIEVRVCDGGPGVPEEFRPHLFERFSRGPGAARQTEGSGLGLWIVRSLARANGGDAFYEPGDLDGACFGLRLPQAQSAASCGGRIGDGSSPGSSDAPSTRGCP
jgi:signal transduction histidine kinase